MLLWVAALRARSTRTTIALSFAAAGFEAIGIERTGVYKVEDAREFLTSRSVDVDAIAQEVGDKFMSAFVRAKKPRVAPNISAGSHPKGAINPFALKVLGSSGYPTDGYRSKNRDEFAAPGAPVMDFVFTVCDSAAGEVCPVWPWTANDRALGHRRPGRALSCLDDAR
jgi:hypothetical protein